MSSPRLTCLNQRRGRALAMATALFAAACSVPIDTESPEDEARASQSNIDPRRSLVVTEQPILDRFPLKRVLDQLVAQSGVPGLTSLQLFRQWWDTQNPAPGLGLGRHCDTFVDGGGNPVVNTYPYVCRPAPSEGMEATGDPFVNPGTNPGEYIPIGLFNRFDIAPANGSHCGEHRIVYARRSGISDTRNRNLLIFEAVVPNPTPLLGLLGCQRIAKFWADLTKETKIAKRAAALEAFYFYGLPPVAPVVHVNHFGSNPTGVGQIRTNQFIQPLPISPVVWNLREFKLIRTCAGGTCTALEFVPVSNKLNPFGPLFSPGGTHPQTAAFQAHFLGQVASLAATTLPDINMNIPDVFNTGQSLASGSTENNYVSQFAGPSSFRSDLEGALLAVGSTLTADEIVTRAQALSCAGCHRLNNNASLGGALTWPPSLGFTHVAENQTEVVGGVTRFVISNALTSSFLPKRKQVLDDFIDNRPLPPMAPDAAIGGRPTH